jgi:hypothetical protein
MNRFVCKLFLRRKREARRGRSKSSKKDQWKARIVAKIAFAFKDPAACAPLLPPILRIRHRDMEETSTSWSL